MQFDAKIIEVYEIVKHVSFFVSEARNNLHEHSRAPDIEKDFVFKCKKNENFMPRKKFLWFMCSKAMILVLFKFGKRMR